MRNNKNTLMKLINDRLSVVAEQISACSTPQLYVERSELLEAKSFVMNVQTYPDHCDCRQFENLGRCDCRNH